MRNILLFGLAVLVLTCTATAYGVGFTAYNDFNMVNSSVPMRVSVLSGGVIS